MKFFVFTVLLFMVHSIDAQFETEVDEIAPYNITGGGKGFEIREYPPTKWVCHASVERKSSRRQQQSTFWSLFRYITGSNVGENKIPMTAPVSMLKTSVGDSTSLQMCFYLPAAHQASPPAPTETGVYIEDRPRFKAYTRRFGGFANKERVWKNEAEKLMADLKAADISNANFTFYYRAGYDSPMQFTDRRNEIWYLLEN